MLRRKQEGAGEGGTSGVKFIWEALQIPAPSWRVIRLINALQSPAVESDFIDCFPDLFDYGTLPLSQQNTH